MRNEEFWKSVAMEKERSAPARIGVLRLAMLFGTFAVALALLLPPLMISKSQRQMAFIPAAGIDTMTTGTIAANNTRSYTIRRSILQSNPGALCVIDGINAPRGDC